MKKQISAISILLLILSIFFSCEKDMGENLPYSKSISSSSTGLIGVWKGVSMTVYSTVNTGTDSEGNGIYIDSTGVFYPSDQAPSSIYAWDEYIQFSNQLGVDSFTMAANNVDLDQDSIAYTAINFEISQGHWAVIETIDPMEERATQRSLILFDPANKHNVKMTIAIAIQELTSQKLILAYSWGTDATLSKRVIKTYELVN